MISEKAQEEEEEKNTDENTCFNLFESTFNSI